MTDQWTEGAVDAAGIDIRYVRTGAGSQPPLILIHGFTDNGRCWTRVAKELESSFDIVMVDLRNHGLSAEAVGSCADMADDVAAVARALGVSRASVVGHSLGAVTAAEVAARHADLVSRLVLEDPPWRQRRSTADPASPGHNARREGLQGFIDSFAGMSHEQIVTLGRGQHPTWHDLEFDAWAASKLQVRPSAIESITPHHWSELVPEFSCPTLLIHGDADLGGIVTPELAAEVSTLNAMASAASVPNAGHNVRREGFEAYIDLVGPFLSAN